MELKLLFNKIKYNIRKKISYPVLYNVNGVDENVVKKRALLIYLIKPFKLNKNSPKFLTHQNLKQTLQIASILGDFGYIVDVADVKSEKIKTNKYYNLLISHNFKLDISTINLTHGAIKIYLASGMNHITNNVNIKKRYEEIYMRRQCSLIRRRLNDENMRFVEKADYIVGFGNQYTMETWAQNFKQKKYCFNNYGFNINFKSQKKFEMAKKNFIYFASSGNVGKGLNLLLEVFPKLKDLNLYIVGNFKKEKDFCKCYHKELFKTPNVHPIGWLDIASLKFQKIMEKCAFVVLPSASEGQPGSVVQCMHSGVIPVVTKECGIDTEDYGITLVDDSLQEIERTIIKLSNKSPEWVRTHSEKTRKVAIAKFSEDAFVKRWREILQDILLIK